MSEWILAIDYGTTFSSGVIAAEGRFEPIELDGSTRMSSMVLLSESGELVTGLAAERQLALTPSRVERSPKRRLGDPVILLAEQPVRPVDAVAAVLRRIGSEALRLRGDHPPREVRMTYPARWGERRLEVLREAARIAGFDNVVLIAEPVAAAVYFADHLQTQGSFVAVYDLGGGTFDTAVLRRSADGFEVVGAPGGDERLGGEDFDERLYQHLGARISEINGDAWEQLRFADERPWRRANQEFRTEVRRAKEALSLNSDYTVYVGAPADIELRVTRDEFEALIAADVSKSVDELESTIARAGVPRNQIAGVYLAGGSSRIPLVSRLVGSRLGIVPETFGDPKLITAIGAARATNVSVSPVPAPTQDRVAERPKVRPPVRAEGYELLGELGSGGMGVVYLAVQSSLGRLVALKTLPTLAAHLADRLEREGQVLARLQHPRLVTVIDVDRTDGTTNLVMPFFAGGSLQHALASQGRLTGGQTVSMLSAMAEALDACHRAGVLHRDVKPSNILLSTDGEAYLADFGLAHYEEASRLTPSNSAMGTTGYAAPEVLAGQECTPASDVYSLGVCGYHALAGRGPVEGMSLFAAIDMVRNGSYPRLADVAPDAPAGLVALIEQAMSVDPAARPRDLRSFAAELRAEAAAEPIPAAPPPDWARLAAGRSSGTDHLAAATPTGPVVSQPTTPQTRSAPTSTVVSPPDDQSFYNSGEAAALAPAELQLTGRLAKAAARAERHAAASLHPDETVEAVVPMVQAGLFVPMYPLFAALSVWFLRQCAIVVTNERVLLMQGATPVSSATKRVRAAFPRAEVRVAPVGFGLVMLPSALLTGAEGAKFCIHRRYAWLVEELSKILGAAPARGVTRVAAPVPTTPAAAAPSGAEVIAAATSRRVPRRNVLVGAGVALALLFVAIAFAAQRSDDAGAADGGVSFSSPASSEATTATTATVDLQAVPNVVGLSEDEAISTLEIAGFEPQVTYRPTADATQVGVVLRQFPAVGKDAEAGSPVLITVGETLTESTSTLAATTVPSRGSTGTSPSRTTQPPTTAVPNQKPRWVCPTEYYMESQYGQINDYNQMEWRYYFADDCFVDDGTVVSWSWGESAFPASLGYIYPYSCTTDRCFTYESYIDWPNTYEPYTATFNIRALDNSGAFMDVTITFYVQ